MVATWDTFLLLFFIIIFVFDGDNSKETMIVLWYLWMYIQSQEIII